MSADNSTFGVGHFIDPKFGSAVQIPLNFFTSGMVDAYQGYFGSLASQGLDFAALNISPNFTAPLSIFSKGINSFVGSTTQDGIHVTNGQHMVNGTELRTFVVNNDLDGVSNNLVAAESNTLTAATSNKFVAPVNIISGTITRINGLLNLDGVGDVAIAIKSKKGFDIPHPNKPNHRLRHICVEGPESAVYIRGRINGNNKIKIPEYWKGLVDFSSITVNLTQIGTTQDLIVENITEEEIKIKSGSASNINCYYHIWADRLGDKLIPEYEGQTPDDYPGDNSQYSLAGWNYDKRQ